MMRSSAKDAIIKIDGRLLTFLAQDDFADLVYENDLVVWTSGYNGNDIIRQGIGGDIATLTLKIVKASPDDAYLNFRRAEMARNFTLSTPMSISMQLPFNDGSSLVYYSIQMPDATFSKNPSTKVGSDGDSGTSMYIIKGKMISTTIM